jgi:hypothetical protein
MKKIIIFLMAFGFLLLSITGWGQESVIYSTGFESSEGFTAGTVYNNTTIKYDGSTGVQWGTYYGTASTTSPISEAQSMQMRWYTSATANLGYTFMNFDLANVTKVTFLASSTSGINVIVSYSIDGGESFIGNQLFTLTGTATEYTYNVSATGEFDNIRVKFEISLPDPIPGGTSRLYIDDVSVYGINGSSVPPFIANITQDPATDITSSSSISVSADVTAGDAAIDFVELRWGTETGVYGNTINMAAGAGVNYTAVTNIPAQPDGTSVYYVVYAQDVDGESATSAEQSYTVTDPATTTLPYIEDFSSDFGDIYTYTVAGSNHWAIVSDGAQANGYNGENPEEHWLVLPGIDFNAYSDEVITFTNYARYGIIDENNYLKLFYSSDYPGIGNPTTYTWNELAFDQPAAGLVGTTEIETSSGMIDLSSINGNNVYLAFQYYSTDNPTSWRVDDILIYENHLASEPTNHPTAFQATANSSSAITVSWADSDAASYLIKGSSVGFGDIAAPVDGTPVANGALVQNVSAGLHSHQFTGLDAETTYYFKIFPYNGLETTINYKVDGAPQDDATTLEGIDFIVIDFDNADNWIAGAVSLSSYAIDHNYVDGVFSATGGEALRNGTSTQDGFPGALGTYSWRLRDNTSVEWTITIASGGVGLFEVDVRRWDGSPSPDYNLDYSVDGGNNWTNITTINNTSLDNSSDWKTFTGTINHTASNIMIRFIANGSTERIMIDNFKWTAFVGETATNWLADAGSSNWNDPNNWSNGLPGIVSDVVINSGTNDPLLQSGYTIQSLNISSGAKLNIGTSGQLSVTGTLTNNAGTTGLYIHSAANGTGSLIHNTDNVPFTIERYVSGGQNAGGGTSPYKYHLISIPLAGDIQAGDVFTGTYLWHFVPNQTGENAWSGITSLTENLDNQKGFLSYVEETENTFTFTGTMNNGSFSVAAENIDAGNVKLIPNPYPSAIDWEAVDLTGTGLNPTIWLFNSNTGNYESYNAGVGAGQRYIPVGQAVFAEAATANPTLTFTNAHRTHNQGNGFYKSGNETIADMIKIAVSANNSSDATFIRFREQADNTYNGFDDASKLKGFSGAPQLYTYSTDNRALSINTLATSQETMIVPLAFELEVSAEAVMSFEYLETFEPTVQIFLEDLLTNQMVDLRENSNYTFSHEASHDPDRFKLHFMGVTSLDEQMATADHFRVWTNENQLYVLPTDELTKGQLQIELFDLSGRLIQSINQQVQKPMILSLPDYEGIMLVRIQNEKLVQTQKIFIR